MKSIIFLVLLFVCPPSLIHAQNFQILMLIDNEYNKDELNNKLEELNVLSLIKDDNFKIRMISSTDKSKKVAHENTDSNGEVVGDGKKKLKCEIACDSAIKCNPCDRIKKEIKDLNHQIYVIADSKSEFDLCELKENQYKTLLPDEDLQVIIKSERKRAKKEGLNNFKLIFWIPSEETVTLDLLSDNKDEKLDCGSVVTLTAKTNSKKALKIEIKVNDKLIEQCEETGFTSTSLDEPFSFPIEITQETKVTMTARDCGGIEKEKLLRVSKAIESEIEQVKHYLLYDSRDGKPLGKEDNDDEDGIECTEIRLIGGNHYYFVINKQCGITEYRLELKEKSSKKTINIILQKAEAEETMSKLNNSDRNKHSLYTLGKGTLETNGVFDKVKKNGEEWEPKYDLRIVPVDAIQGKESLKNKGSEWKPVKFQKC
jgi:hypothetical protein